MVVLLFELQTIGGMASSSRKYSLLVRNDDDDVEIAGYESEDAALAFDSDQELTGQGNVQIDPQQGRFPYCIVWTPIPLLTYVVCSASLPESLYRTPARDGGRSSF